MNHLATFKPLDDCSPSPELYCDSMRGPETELPKYGTPELLALSDCAEIRSAVIRCSVLGVIRYIAVITNPVGLLLKLLPGEVEAQRKETWVFFPKWKKKKTGKEILTVLTEKEHSCEREVVSFFH